MSANSTAERFFARTRSAVGSRTGHDLVAERALIAQLFPKLGREPLVQHFVERGDTRGPGGNGT